MQTEFKIPFSQSLPTPAECRDVDGSIDWYIVDVWLRRASYAGALRFMAKAMGISIQAMRMRRQELNLPGLPTGRPAAVQLTEWERRVMVELKAESSKTAVAAKLGVSRAAIYNAAEAVARKAREVAAKGCLACMGAGVRECADKCANGRRHQHVCDHCGGQSTYLASEELYRMHHDGRNK